MILKIKHFLSYSFCLYALVGFLFLFVIDKNKLNFYRINELETFADQAVRLNPNADIRLWQSTIRYYKLLKSSYPFSVRSEEMIGYSYFFLHDINQSQDYYKKALSLKPQHFWLRYNLGILCYIQGDWSKAEGYFDEILQESIQQQIRASCLSPLNSLEVDNRQKLFSTIPSFVDDVRAHSVALLIAIRSGHTLDPSQVGAPILHPWSYVFLPGKEVLVR